MSKATGTPDKELKERYKQLISNAVAREKWGWLVVGVLAATLIGMYLYTKSNGGPLQGAGRPRTATNATTMAAQAEFETGGLSCTPSHADLLHPTRQDFSSKDIALAKASYNTPDVRGLRSAILAYLAGQGDSETSKNLERTSQELLARRFILLAVEPSLFGGSFITLEFDRHPTTVYRAWVYKHGGGRGVVRAWDAAACSRQQQHWTATVYGQAFRELGFSTMTDGPVPRSASHFTVDSRVRAAASRAATIAFTDKKPKIVSINRRSDPMETSKTSNIALGCSALVIDGVHGDGATVSVSGGALYTISDQGLMRFEVAKWSTGDKVTVCSSGADASIANPVHYSKVQARYLGTAESAPLQCNDQTIANVRDDGATVSVTNGTSYAISAQGLMRFEVAEWSTGDKVTVCSSGADASIANPVHYAKVQARYLGVAESTRLQCNNRTIASVRDDGATVSVNDGTSYTISSQGLMRFEVARWSTGDKVIVCRSGADASIANSAHYAKVQATVAK